MFGGSSLLATRQAWVRLRAFKLWVEIRGCGGTASSSNFNCKYSVRESAKQLQRMCENVHRLIATSKPALQVPPAEEPVPKASGWYCDVHPGTEIAWLVPEGNPIKVCTPDS